MNGATKKGFRIYLANGCWVGGTFKTRENAERQLAKYAKHPAYDTSGARIEEVG